MLKNYGIVIGTILLLVGVLGWIFREGFGEIPLYLLIFNIVAGIWGPVFGWSKPRAE